MAGDVTLRGPLFHQRHQLMLEFAGEGREAVARAALSQVQANLAGSLQHPTGHYQGKVIVDRSFTDRDLVTDQGVIYGPWLEGVGSRNQNTRFKGYSSFRRAAQSIGGQVELILAPVIAATMARFNR